MTGHELAANLRGWLPTIHDDPALAGDIATAADTIEKQQRRLDALCLVLGCNCEDDD